jgi:hypothetical protein
MITSAIITPVIFAAGIAYCLWMGPIPVRGREISRTTEPGTYWFTLGFFAVCTVWLVSDIIFPNWGFAVLRAAGFTK